MFFDRSEDIKKFMNGPAIDARDVEFQIQS